MSETTTPAAPVRSQFKPLTQVRTIQEALQHPDAVARFREAVPKHLSPERMLRVCALAVQKTPKLRECEPITLLGAMLALATLGMEPNTPLGHAYLIPFAKRKKDEQTGKWVDGTVEVQVIIGYRGYIDLASRRGNMVSLHADVVYEGDEFSFEYGSNMHLRHKPVGARTSERRPLYAYFHAKLSDGEAFEVLPYAEIIRIRDNSEGYKSAERSRQRYPESFAKNPWVAFPHEMASKSMVRRIGKWIPMSIELANAAALDAMSETGGANLRSLAMPGSDSIADRMALTYEEYIPPFDLNPGDQGGYEEEEAPVEPKREEPKPHQQRQADPSRASQQPAQTGQQATQQHAQGAAAIHAEQLRYQPGSQPQERQRLNPAAMAEAPKEEAKPAALQLYLLDAEGSMTEDGFFTAARPYASALGKLIADAFPADREAILEQNAEYMLAAGEADPEAHAMFLAMAGGPAPEESPVDALVPVSVPTKGRGVPDLAAYVAAIRVSIDAEVTDDAALQAWIGCNKPVYEKMPVATRKGIDIAIAARRDALGLSAAPEPQPPQQRRQEPPPVLQPADGPSVDDERQARMEAYVTETVAKIAAMPSSKEALAWMDDPDNRTDMDALKAAFPEGHQRIRGAVSAKMTG